MKLYWFINANVLSAYFQSNYIKYVIEYSSSFDSNLIYSYRTEKSCSVSTAPNLSKLYEDCNLSVNF
jgi:hypothetical protein